MHTLHVFHHSQKGAYRHPFGAVPCAERITITLRIQTSTPLDGCFLRLWLRGQEERVLSMQLLSQEDSSDQETDAADLYEVRFRVPSEPGLVWYDFIIERGEQRFFYHNRPDKWGGEGVLSREAGASFQITVYQPTPVPTWFKQGVMYQIYVDRFYNGHPEGRVLSPKKGSLIHGNWGDTPFYIKDEKGHIQHWTFFGGNLLGVLQKLPLLQEMGISVLYLNPIFEARSNHKYDTADYLKIDPMYGDLATFQQLLRVAKEWGISVILDGVFSHTGSDSIYFNRYGTYDSLGAYQSGESPYSPWYRLERPGGKYDSWWGVEDLPNVNEMEHSYQAFIFGGEDSVIQYWLNQGIKGWRLDVADELPDAFVKGLRASLKEKDSEAVLIGEVWEDASNKTSYGKLREYFWGGELDATMNYPLRELLLDFFLGRSLAGEAYRRLMSLYENYPPENFRAAMNLIGSHDRIRILTLLGEAPPEQQLTEQEKGAYHLSPEARERALARLRQLLVLQMTLPGVPSIYYGDEAGLEGYADPYNRATYPWGQEDQGLKAWTRRLIWLRREYDLCTAGAFYPFYSGDDVLGFRLIRGNEEMLIAVNRSGHESALCLPMDQRERPMIQQEDHWLNQSSEAIQTVAKPIELLLDLLSGERIPPATLIKASPAGGGRDLLLPLGPLDRKVLYLRRQGSESLSCALTKRTCGILLHLTSLPSPWGIGDMGVAGEQFVEDLVSAGQTIWQILPLNPLGEGASPYQSPSVFAGNPLLISLDQLRGEGLLTEEVCQEEKKYLSRLGWSSDQVDFTAVQEGKERLLRQAFRTWQQGSTDGRDDYYHFLEENAFWLEDTALYLALKAHQQNIPWQEWAPTLAKREPEALARSRRELREEIEYHRFVQYIFYRQWTKLRAYANERGIQIFGDIPIYAATDSSDTWAHRELFQLNAEGRPTLVSGVPPDYFSETGQHWGNPLYDWKIMAQDDYVWWKARLRLNLKCFDWIRLDHFRGFEAYWAIPAEEKTAVNGRWLKGPGKRFFESLQQTFGRLPIIAEDLGFLTPEVYNLKNLFAFPGMGIYQFEASQELDPERLQSLRRKDLKEEDSLSRLGSVKELHPPLTRPMENRVLYSGTHDNETLLGWLSDNPQLADLTSDQQQRLLKGILADLYQGDSAWVILPMQDVLGLGRDARMNTPGTVEKNWGWRMKEGQWTKANIAWLRSLAAVSRRD